MEHNGKYIYEKIPKIRYTCAACFFAPYTEAKIVTDSSGPITGLSSTKSQPPYNHSVDTKYYFCHVKFEVRFVIAFAMKAMPNKK
jgi:hypothetical protein